LPQAQIPQSHRHGRPSRLTSTVERRCWSPLWMTYSAPTGTFSSVKVLINQIRDYITHWNTSAKPFVWTATADEILAKVRLIETNIKKLVDNNAK
jgi:hypothetical protein